MMRKPVAYARVRSRTLIQSEIEVDIQERIRHTVQDHPIVLFMKGTPQFPMCGFSARAVQALKGAGAQFASVNVLEDPEIDRKSTRLNSSHSSISYAVFCLKKKNT